MLGYSGYTRCSGVRRDVLEYGGYIGMLCAVGCVGYSVQWGVLGC